MNKDVIYIEPEDDITDIIAKIEKSKEKIVALVPPKKAGVFRSLVNIKLIAKAATTAEKSVVLVTVDPSIVKLAAATKLPVAKNLQSAPVIPETEAEEMAASQTIDEVSEPEEDNTAENATSDGDGGDDKSDRSHRKSLDFDQEKGERGEDEDEDGEEEPAVPEKKSKKSPKQSKNRFVNWLKQHRKLAIASGVCVVALIGFLVWAFGFAPAVDITVAIKTDSKNFSEGITFADALTSEDAKEGKFYLEEKKIESVQEVNFDATGEKNEGEKATGEITVIATIDAKNGGTKVINTGDTFTFNGLSYAADNSVTMRYDGSDDSVCKNADSVTKREFDAQGCRIYADVKVTAAAPGEKYNISASSSGWSTTANIEVYTASAMTGGTDKIVTVVQQSDIIKAENQLTAANEEENKNKLYSSIGDDYLIIESTFEQKTASATATPAADQEVQDGTQPKLTAATTTSVYVLNRHKLEEFIENKADLEEGQKVYEVKDIYIENFTNNGASSTAKLKAQYYIGPKITETEVVEKIKGKGLGDAQREIRDFYGVSDVKINTSYPWVMAVPGDSNKVTVRFEVKDQDGNEVKAQDGENTDSDEGTDSDQENNSEEKSEN